MTDAHTFDFDRIVVPLDGSVVATLGLVTAARVAAATGASIEGVTVVDPDAGDDRAAARFDDAERQRDITLAGRHVFDASDAAAELLDFAHRERDPALSMATRGHGDLRAGVLGNVTGAVVRSLGRELLLSGPRLRGDASEPLRELHVCVDGSDVSDAMVPIALAWAQRLRLRVDVVHVATPFPHPDAPASLVRPDEGEALELVRRTTERFRAAGLDAGWTLIEETEVARELVAAAQRAPGGMLALATHGRTGLARVLLGSVANAVLRTTTAPALVVRPSDLLH